MSEGLRGRIKKRYAEAVTSVRRAGGGGVSCCEPSCYGPDEEALAVGMTGGSYSGEEKSELPRGASDASLGCGNPVALAALSPGEVVLDLGSGGGIDVLLSARRVLPGGKAYGLGLRRGLSRR